MDQTKEGDALSASQQRKKSGLEAMEAEVAKEVERLTVEFGDAVSEHRSEADLKLLNVRMDHAKDGLQAIRKMRTELQATDATAEKALEIFGDAVGRDASENVKKLLLSQVESTRALAVAAKEKKLESARALAADLKVPRVLPPLQLSSGGDPLIKQQRGAATTTRRGSGTGATTTTPRDRQQQQQVAALKKQATPRQPQRPTNSTRAVLSPRGLALAQRSQQKTIPFPLPR